MWFTPPKTTKYRFYMTCDDQCMLKIAQCPGSISPTTTLLDLNKWTKYNSFWSNENRYSTSSKPTKVSNWVELEEGKNYYMYAKYREGGGGDHMRTGVEIANSGIVGHHQTMKEIQTLKAYPSYTFEKTILLIDNPDEGTFIWTRKIPNTDEYVPTEKISTSATASQMRSAIKGFYADTKKTDIIVKLYQMDEDGQNCTVSGKPVKQNRYEIALMMLISGEVSLKTNILTKFGS